MSVGRLDFVPAAASPDLTSPRLTRSRPRLRVAALVVLVMLSTGACRVRADIGIEMKEDGSGTVTVRIGLEDDAIKQAPKFQQSLKVDDLTAHGWTVSGGVKETDGFTYFSISKLFANPDEANAIFKEIAGDQGPFRDFTISRSRSFAHTNFTFSGTVDFSRGLESFSDSDLAQQLDNKPLGDDIKAIEQRINDSLDNVFQINITVRLPGNVDSNAPGQFANGARWQPKLSEPAPVTLTASSSSTRWFSIVGAAVAGVSGVGLLIVLPV